MKVFLVFVSKHGEIKIPKTPLIESVLSYENVHFKWLDLHEFSIGSPLEDFIKNDRLKESIFIVAHTADALRYLLLWKYGGTYLDSDVIAMKPSDSIPLNYACEDVGNFVLNGILNVENNEKGKSFAELFMKNLSTRFNASFWGAIGPYLVTEAIQELCQTNITAEMVEKKDCQGFHVMSRISCYAITGFDWMQLFNETIDQETRDMVKDSVYVHFWNNLSKKYQLRANSSSIYTQMARKYCPKTIASCGEYF
jgi:lactosylceramide 4-alpha-galactosyltransferase